MKKCVNAAQVDLTELLNTLPPMIARKDIDKYLGGIISKGYLANLDSKGEGPPKVKIGKNVGYLRRPLVEWLAARGSVETQSTMPNHTQPQRRNNSKMRAT